MIPGVFSIVLRPRVIQTGLIVLGLALTQVPPVFAWGAHARITIAAQEALGPDHTLARHLGRDFALLPAYCWMADWRRGLIVRSPGGAFNADDYLLFPSSPVHREHECPFVQATYRPFFRRAVQALHTETPANAVRWIGSLLHFVEDSGSPPHALPTPGELHTRMENWVDAGRVDLAGYRPQVLGNTETEAADGFVRRMEGLIAYSRARGLKLLPIALAGRRAEAEPIELESALETSRVVADVLATLGRFLTEAVPGMATLRGTIARGRGMGPEALPAKVVLEGTDHSTLAGLDGSFVLRNLPPGDYRMSVIRPGCDVVSRSLALTAGQERIEDFVVPEANPPAGFNLVRNPSFQLRWLRPAAPDGWYRTGGDATPAWQGEPSPVEAGRRYRLAVAWKPGAEGTATLIWSTRASRTYEPGVEVLFHSNPKVTAKPELAPEELSRVYTAPNHARSVLIVFCGAGSPETLCTRVELTPEP